VNRVFDYLLLRTPEEERGRLGGVAPSQKPKSSGTIVRRSAAVPGRIPTDRIVLSLVGLFLGVLLSFVVTGLTPTQTDATGAVVSQPKVQLKLSLAELVVSVVIIGLTYSGLYQSLKLYRDNPTLLILFVSFQYGYFWQSLIKGGATLLR